MTRLNSQAGQVTRWVLIAFVMILLFLAVWLIRDILMLTLMAIIVALLITTPVRFFMRFGVRRSMAVTITLVLVLLVIVLVGALIVPGLLNQFQQLIVLLQHALLPDTFSIHAPVLDSEHLTVLLRRTLQPGNWAASFDFLRGVDLTNLTKQISTQVFDSIANLPSQVFPFVGSLASVLLGLLVVVFMGLYFVADPGVYERGTLSLFPVNYRPRAQEIMHKLEISLRNFLQAQVILMAITGVGTTVTLVLLGIPLAGALGTLTGLFSFVPNFGPLVALLPIIAVVILNEPSKIISVIAVFYALQLIQSQLLAPLLVGQEIHLPPVVILLAQIIAGIFFGFLGILLSVPLAAIVVVLVREVYIHDILGDGSAEVPEPPVMELDLIPDRV